VEAAELAFDNSLDTQLYQPFLGSLPKAHGRVLWLILLLLWL
jgi:hypothetical protein